MSSCTLSVGRAAEKRALDLLLSISDSALLHAEWLLFGWSTRRRSFQTRTGWGGAGGEASVMVEKIIACRFLTVGFCNQQGGVICDSRAVVDGSS